MDEGEGRFKLCADGRDPWLARLANLRYQDERALQPTVSDSLSVPSSRGRHAWRGQQKSIVRSISQTIGQKVEIFSYDQIEGTYVGRGIKQAGKKEIEEKDSRKRR